MSEDYQEDEGKVKVGGGIEFYNKKAQPENESESEEEERKMNNVHFDPIDIKTQRRIE